MPGFFTRLFLPSQRQISSVMSKATVSVLPVMPRIQGGGPVYRLMPEFRPEDATCKVCQRRYELTQAHPPPKAF